MKFISLSFLNNESIPAKYTCNGESVNPPLEWDEVPAGTKSFAIIFNDPDAPSGDFVHWLVWNIPANVRRIEEGKMPDGAVVGLNSTESNSYIGPCPPTGEHHYVFRLYALEAELDLPLDTDRHDLEAAMNGLILDQAELVGLYEQIKS